ncbi:MAG: rhodanese-like domain-containing protein [Methanoregula sp.]|nr:MAG: rhodanese-like domain-containing protein [Methanoregula sp.]
MTTVKVLSLILIIMLSLLACGCTQPAAPPSGSSTSYTDVTPAEAKTLIDTHPDLVIIDVSPYYDRGHLPGAISIPVSALSSRLPDLDRTRPYLVYCHGDAPSIQGATTLVNAGFSPVYRLKGNYAAWVSAGYKVEM